MRTPPIVNLPAGSTLLLQVLGGSRAYGMETETSDWDWRGVFLASPDAVWSLHGPPEQIIKSDPDICYWELKKFLHLGLKGNPTILETLWTPPVVPPHELGQSLLDLRTAFLSKRVLNSYCGFAGSQWQRLVRFTGTWGPREWKHYKHMIRLLTTAHYLLVSGDTVLVRLPEVTRQFFTNLEQLPVGTDPQLREHYYQHLLKAVREAARTSTLPEQPRQDLVEQFLIQTRKRHAFGH